MDWQCELDAYLFWTRTAEQLEMDLAKARANRAKALRRMNSAGPSVEVIARVVGLSTGRVGQLMRQAPKG